MAKTTTAKNSFNSGEVSPRALGRFDQQRFLNAVKVALNVLLHQIGGIFFRPGTVYVAPTKTAADRIKLIPFQYSTSQGYMIEAGNLYFRYCTQSAQLINAGVPVELVTPYAIADVFGLKWTQNANTQYFVHNNYAPYKHQRVSAILFSLVKVKFVRGPFLDANITQTTLAPAAATGNTTVTAAAPAWAAGTGYVSGPTMPDFVTNGGNTYQAVSSHVSGAVFATDFAAGLWTLIGAGNTPQVFQAGHVGSLWRIKGGVVQILTVTNAYTVSVAVQAEPSGVAGNLGGTAAVTDWAEGAFSGVRGYPSAVVFHGQRLYYGGTIFQPQTFWGSYLGQYDNFDTGSTTSDSNAVTFTLGSDQVNAIRWLASVAQALQNGTSGGTFSANPAGSAASITPTSIQVSNDTSYGVSAITPKKLSSYLYYIQKNGFALRELVYNYLVDRQVTTDLTDLADHILRDGLGAVDMDYQQSPMDRIWVVRNDGQIAILIRNVEQKVLGWSRILMGASAFGAGAVESIGILQNDAADDQIYVSVRRIINGVTLRWIEYFSSEYFTNPWDPIRLDASSTYDVPIAITGASNGNPVVITAPSHGLSNGDQIKVDKIQTSINQVLGDSPLNGNIYIVAGAAANTFQVNTQAGATVNGAAFGTYISGGQVRKMVSVISGLSYLNGETVSVMIDGGLPSGQQLYLVSGGQITLSQKAAVVHIGLPYTGTIQFLKFSDGAVVGQTKMRRIYLSTLRVFQSLGGKIGRNENELVRLLYQAPNDPLGAAPKLFTGDIDKFYDTAWRQDDEPVIQQDQPLPLFLEAAFFRSDVYESE